MFHTFTREICAEASGELPTRISKKTEQRNNYLYLRLTPLVIPGIAAGYTHRINVSENKVIDITVAVNYHDWDIFVPGIFKSLGVSFITEHFSNPKATGLFSRLNLGAEYINEPSTEEKPRWIPNATMGLGYSMQIFHGSYVRISAELGYTMLVGRINCEFLF